MSKHYVKKKKCKWDAKIIINKNSIKKQNKTHRHTKVLTEMPYKVIWDRKKINKKEDLQCNNIDPRSSRLKFQVKSKGKRSELR